MGGRTRRPWCARVEVSSIAEGGLRVGGYHDRVGYREGCLPRARRECEREADIQPMLSRSKLLDFIGQ
jgi:hypothetical protein